MTGMTLYTDDNHEFFPPNPDDGNLVPGYNWCPGSGGSGEAQEFDPDILKDPTRSLLISYLGGNVKVFHCPADQRQGRYQGSDQAMAGKIIPAARTYSMNQAVGTIDPGYTRRGSIHYGIPNLPVNGPWLNGTYFSNHHNDPWATYGKASETTAPGPSKLWILVGENSNGLNDSAFAFEMIAPNWLDAPGSYHNGVGCMAFADGHSELHKWLVRPAEHSPANPKDWWWMQQRTSVQMSK